MAEVHLDFSIHTYFLVRYGTKIYFGEGLWWEGMVFSFSSPNLCGAISTKNTLASFILGLCEEIKIF